MSNKKSSKKIADARGHAELKKLQEAEQARREELQMKYQMLRATFDLELLELGIHEFAFLNMDKVAGIIPQLGVAPIENEEEGEKQKEELKKLITDMKAMSGSAILGADGEPTSVEKGDDVK